MSWGREVEGFSTKRVAQIALAGVFVLTVLQLQPVNDPLVREREAGRRAVAEEVDELGVAPVDQPLGVIAGSRGAGARPAPESAGRPGR
jgi:hypothetical protein